jgi:recombinational DNA repair protein RecR
MQRYTYPGSGKTTASRFAFSLRDDEDVEKLEEKLKAMYVLAKQWVQSKMDAVP